MSAATLEVWPGVPYPLGASWDGRGVNFAVYSERAEGIDLCLFDPQDSSREVARLPLRDLTHHVWHRYVPELGPGTLYGFRAHGPYQPKQGLRFNPHKLLVDPYARAIHGKVSWKYALYGYHHPGQEKVKQEDRDLTFDQRDDAAGVPKSVVVDDHFDWGEDRPPGILWRRTILYELHLKGFTARHPQIPEPLRGTYSGLAHPAAIDYLKSLGVTSVELLPIHEAVDEGHLVERGLKNYWGYNTLGFFAPDQRFSSRGSRGEQVREFKQMVRALHRAGLEVILDVVYTHTCEGNELGPTLSFRGLDNSTYYWLLPDEPRRYLNFTGCGNSVNANHPQVSKLICDSLRYWVSEMHVDGFRFDLATTLGRAGKGAHFDRNAPLFQALHQDPLLSRVKLIGEPWDLGPDGYQPGNLPSLWAEWNDRYRDTIRRFWKGEEGQAAEIGYRLTGSSDLFRLSGRRPTSSVNYLASHDGLTLQDLVSYNQKHNQANGERNQDGAPDDYSWNCGVEGETSDPQIVSLREKQQRNFLATLFLSPGTPMLLAGDELGRTQGGNNNGYCQDNELSWLDWELSERKQRLLEFTQRMVQLRQRQPVLQRRNFFQGATIGDSRFRDVVWFRPDGMEMTPEDWTAPYRQSLGYLLGGDAVAARDPRGRLIVGDTLLLLLNADPRPVSFTLPGLEWGAEWELVVDTSAEAEVSGSLKAGQELVLDGRSLRVLRHGV